jgi:hypothetical protein
MNPEEIDPAKDVTIAQNRNTRRCCALYDVPTVSICYSLSVPLLRERGKLDKAIENLQQAIALI